MPHIAPTDQGEGPKTPHWTPIVDHPRQPFAWCCALVVDGHKHWVIGAWPRTPFVYGPALEQAPEADRPRLEAEFIAMHQALSEQTRHRPGRISQTDISQ